MSSLKIEQIESGLWNLYTEVPGRIRSQISNILKPENNLGNIDFAIVLPCLVAISDSFDSNKPNKKEIIKKVWDIFGMFFTNNPVTQESVIMALNLAHAMFEQVATTSATFSGVFFTPGDKKGLVTCNLFQIGDSAAFHIDSETGNVVAMSQHLQKAKKGEDVGIANTELGSDISKMQITTYIVKPGDQIVLMTDGVYKNMGTFFSKGEEKAIYDDIDKQCTVLSDLFKQSKMDDPPAAGLKTRLIKATLENMEDGEELGIRHGDDCGLIIATVPKIKN